MPGDQRRRLARGEKKTAIKRCLIEMKNIWIGKDKIYHNIKIKLYKALVKSILT